MKPSTLLLTGASLAAAQKLSDFFPKCGVDCLAESVAAASDCSVDDAWCICVQKTYEEITTHGTACVLKSCGADVAIGEVLPAAVPYCEAATASHEAESAPSTSAAAKPTTAASTPSTTAQPPKETESESETETETETESTSETSSSASASGTDDAEEPEESGEVVEDSGSMKVMPALVGMLALGAAAAF